MICLSWNCLKKIKYQESGSGISYYCSQVSITINLFLQKTNTITFKFKISSFKKTFKISRMRPKILKSDSDSWYAPHSRKN